MYCSNWVKFVVPFLQRQNISLENKINECLKKRNDNKSYIDEMTNTILLEIPSLTVQQILGKYSNMELLSTNLQLMRLI